MYYFIRSKNRLQSGKYVFVKFEHGVYFVGPGSKNACGWKTWKEADWCIQDSRLQDSMVVIALQFDEENMQIDNP
jgi:hypothetical protein